MPDRPQSTLDFYHANESTRRQLWDLIRAMYFIPRIDIKDPELSEEPLYNAEEASLTVFFGYGRWWAVWCKLEVPPDRPECDQIEMLRIKPASEMPLGFSLHEC